MLKRRDVIKAIGYGGLALGLPLPFSLLAQGQGLKTRSLGDNISLISGAGSHVLVAQGPDSVVVVDGGLREHAQALLDEINRISGGKPIQALFNTNWRPEHCGLNYLLGESDTPIIAHENTRLWQTIDFKVEWEGREYQAMPQQAQADAAHSVYDQAALQLGDETVEYGFLRRGHTDGDLYVRFPGANVLMVSDALGAAGYPLLDYVTGGWIGGAQEAAALMLDLADDNTQVVAAQGEVQGRADVQAQAEMLDLAYEKVAEAFRNGYSLEMFKSSEPAADFGERWGDPELFLTQLYRGTWYHVPGRAVRGII